MTIPHSADLGIEKHSWAAAILVACRVHKPWIAPVYIGIIANSASHFRSKWLRDSNAARVMAGKKPEPTSIMDDSCRKYAAQPGFEQGIYDPLWTAGIEVLYGPQRGQPKGHLFLQPRQTEVL